MKHIWKFILFFSVITLVASIEYKELANQYLYSNVLNVKLGKYLPQLREDLLKKTEPADANTIPGFYNARIHSKSYIVQVLLLKKGDVDKLVEEYSFLHGREGVYFSLSGKLKENVAFLAYEKDLSPDPTEFKVGSIDLTHLEGAPVLDFVNRDNTDSQDSQQNQLQPFQLERRIPLLGGQHDYCAYTAHIGIVDLPINDRTIKGFDAVVLVLPYGYNLNNFPPEKYRNSNRYYRVAKKAFINFYKCTVFAIELGNGDVSDLMPGLTISYVTYSLLVDRTPFIKRDAQVYLHSVFIPKSITLKNYTQGVEHPTWGTFEVTIKGPGLKTINVSALVVLLSIDNQEIDKHELSNLKQKYNEMKRQLEPNDFLWYVSDATVSDVIVAHNFTRNKKFAFLAYGKA